MKLYAAIWAAMQAFVANDLDVRAGYIAYCVLLAIFPFLIFAVSLTGLFIGDARAALAVEVLFDFTPPYLAQTLEPVLIEVLTRTPGFFTLFIVLALWAVMRAVEALNRAFDKIYGVRQRGIWLRRKVKALAVVIASAGVVVVLGLSILLAPLLLAYVPKTWVPGATADYLLLRYGIGIAVLYCFLWSLHWLLPNDHARGYLRWPGALFSTLVWVILATGFSTYLFYFDSYTLTYGALAGIVITILFLYLSAAIVLLGAELNVALRRLQVAR